MEIIKDILPIFVNLLLIILLVVGIVLGIRGIKTLDRVNNVVNEVEAKLNKMNSFFHIMDFAADKLSGLTDKMVDGIAYLFSKIFFRKKKKIKKEEIKTEE